MQSLQFKVLFDDGVFANRDMMVRKSMRITPFQSSRPTIRRRGDAGPVDLDGTPLSAVRKEHKLLPRCEGT